MMRISATIAVIVCIAFVATITAGPLLHSIILHSHGHSHSHGGESSVWQSLHAALRHEDKKIFAAVLAMLLFGAFSFFRINVALFVLACNVLQRMRLNNRLLRIFDPATGDYLSQGISPYRRFA